MRVLRGRLTYANVVSTLCLFLLMSGAAYAATTLPKNSVGSKQLKKNAVTGVKVKNGSLAWEDFEEKSLPTGLKGAEGPPGPKGEPGSPGATNAVIRYGANIELPSGASTLSYAACKAGEAVTGGGWSFPNGRPNSHEFFITADRPSLRIEEEGELFFALPPEGTKPTGWIVAMENNTGSAFHFQGYVMCASP